MGSNYKHSLSDLDTVFAAYVSGGKAITTGYKVGGSDLNNRYAPGTTSGTVGYKVGGADLCTLFAPIGGGGGGGGGGSVSPDYCGTTLNGVKVTSASPPASRSLSWSFYSDGTWDTDSSPPRHGVWFAVAPETGIGSSYEVQFSVSGPNSGDDTYTNGAATYSALSATRTVKVTHIGHNNESSQDWAVTAVIRDIATHTVQSSCSVTMHAEVDFT